MAVAIVSYNTRELLRACLDTVRPEDPAEIIVVDNASSDGSVEMVRDRYRTVTLFSSPTNPGYGAAANRAVAACRAPYVLLLNGDTLLQGGALGALRSYLDRHPRVAIVGPRLVHPDGRLQPSCFSFPTPLKVTFGNTAVGRLIRWIPFLRDRHLRVWPHARPRAVPWVRGAALAIRREAFEAVGGFDESFFIYGEEMDLCYRLREANWSVHFAPVTTVIHVGGASTDQRRTDMQVQLFASLRHFYRLHYSRRRLALLIVIVTGFAVAKWCLDRLRLAAVRDGHERARIEEDLAAWKRVALGRWRRQVSGA